MVLASLCLYSTLRLFRRSNGKYPPKYLLCKEECVTNVPFKRTLSGNERDPGPFFINREVQRLMKSLTRIDLQKIYRPRKLGKSLEPPEYKFLTAKELNEIVTDAEKRAQDKLQIPPVVKQREEIDEVLSNDPALQGYSEAKFVFTDITYGVPDKKRLIVVRDENGVLRKATWEERFRMNQIYFPQAERKLTVPHMFEDEYLQLLLEKGEHEFVLDRACMQFEPDDPQYQHVTSVVYADIEKYLKYEILQSTRHFGAFVFYLAWNKNIDNLLFHNIQNERISDAVSLIQLYHILNPEAESAKTDKNAEEISFIQAFIETDAFKKSVLQLALRSYLELEKQRQEVQQGIRHAHGLADT